MTSLSSRHFSQLVGAGSQIVTVAGAVFALRECRPRSRRSRSGWSSVWTARWFSALDGRDALGQRPGHQHAVALQPEVVVQRGGRGAPGSRRSARRVRATGLGRPPEPAPASPPRPASSGMLQPGRAPPPVVGGSPSVEPWSAGDADVPGRRSPAGERILPATTLEHLVKSRCCRREASSRQVRGAATVGRGPAAQRVRRDRGLGAVVLAPVDQHLALASVFFMSLTTRSGWSASSARASSWATSDIWSRGLASRPGPRRGGCPCCRW